MKKIISMILCVLMLASVAAFAVYAEGEESYVAPIVGQTASKESYVVFDFTVPGQAAVGNSTAEAQAMWWGKAKRFGTEFNEADACTKLIFVNSDGNQGESYFTACIPETLRFDPVTLKYMKICYRCPEGAIDTPEFFFGMSEYDSDGEEGTQFYKGQWNPEMQMAATDPYEDDNQWHDLYVDMSECAFWGDPADGYVSEIRLDFFNSSLNADQYLEIKYFAVLRNEEEAYKFGILDDGSFGFRDIEMPTEPEETTVEETTAADTTAADTTAAEVTTAAAEVTTAAEAATTAGAEATTAAEKEGGCGGFVGTGIIALVAVLGVCVLPKKHD